MNERFVAGMGNLNEEGKDGVGTLVHYNTQLMMLKGINHIAPLWSPSWRRGPYVLYANLVI